MLRKIAINSRSNGKFTTEVINNRPHLVTTMISIEGDSVMNGLLYPASEVSAAFNQLDSLPAPAGHPTINGEKVSAFHPLAINAHNVGGFVRSPRLDGNRVINELVFDIAVAEKDPRGASIIQKIKNGQAIGVSTGLNAAVDRKSGKIGNSEYTGIVSDIQFDHVAVLPDDEPPAGSTTYTINSGVTLCNMAELDDDNFKPVGNSVNVNNNEVNDMDKEKLVLAMIGNSANRYTMADKDSLMSMSEAELVNGLHSNIEVPEPTVDVAQKVIESNGLTVNSADFDKEKYGEFLINSELFDEFLASKAAEKTELVDKIVANSKMTKEQVEAMPIDSIESLANSLVPSQNYQMQGQPITNNDRQSAGTIELHEDA